MDDPTKLRARADLEEISSTWGRKKPEFELLIKRYGISLYFRHFSRDSIVKQFETGFETSDRIPTLQDQLQFWEQRVTASESKVNKVEKYSHEEREKYKNYVREYVDRAIQYLRQNYTAAALKNPSASMKKRFFTVFHPVFQREKPALQHWFNQSKFSQNGRHSHLTIGKIIEKLHSLPNNRLEILAHAADQVETTVHSSDSTSPCSGPSARCILQSLFLPSPGIALNLPLTA